MNPPRHASRGAFTLVELLVTICIIAALVTITLPSLPGLSRASDMNRAVSDISLLLESSRAYAMAHNTYVWIGFSENAGGEPGGHKLTVGLVAGTSGASDDLETGSIAPISKLRAYDRFSLRSVGVLSGMESNGDDIGGSQFGTFRQTSGGTALIFSKVLRYNPQGEAAIKASGGGSHWIDIGLQPMRGDNANGTDVAVFQVGTLTGRVGVFRR